MSFDAEAGNMIETGFSGLESSLAEGSSPAQSIRRTAKKDGAKKVSLKIREIRSDDATSELAAPSQAYAGWLRIVMLRVLIGTPALGRLKGRAGYNLTQTCEFLGFENFENFAESRSLGEIRKELATILQGWEAQTGTECRFPVVLHKNLDALANIIGLNRVETDILGLAVLVHAESVLESCCDLLGSELGGHSAERILAPMLGHPVDAVAKCLERTEKLHCSGLLSIDISGRYGLRQLMDLLTATFASRMLAPQTDIRKIVEAFVQPVPPSTLSLSDYTHISADLDICHALLKKSSEQHSKGINILVYGRPGTGKTEFARLLASDLQLPLMEIQPCKLDGAPVAPIRRVRNYRIAQAFFKHSPNLILFDECEEILIQGNTRDNSDDEATVPRKSWINKTLETNDVPTIWIANSVRRFDESYLRRFSFCFEMPMPTQVQREKMLATALGHEVGASAQASIAQHKEATPALISQTAGVLRTIAGDKTAEERGQLAIFILNSTLKAQRKRSICGDANLGVAGGDFRPAWVNSEVDLQTLRDSLQLSRAGRLCLWGPPGTGKTAFGKWLAREMGTPHLVLKASELLSPYVGQTEQNIARAFETARHQRALLQFDEVDSFLQDRQKASKQWEITQVNEMLTQMESFDGVFIASTNLFSNLDEASLRRFDMAIKFDFMKPDAVWAMFQETCEFLGISDAEGVRLSLMATPMAYTPGDFEQLTRRSRLLQPSHAAQILQSLKSAVALKKTKTARTVGFLNS